MKFVVVLVSLVSLVTSCLPIRQISTDDWRNHFEAGHTKEEIFSNFNLHRTKWWNYYARGRWFAEGKFWNEAAADFQLALKVRSQDQRNARSYGMHFWDYYAHRELGVCYYNMGKYSDAIDELEESLKTVDTAKAKYYLNKANLAILSKNNLDKTPPEIFVQSFKDGDFVNSFTQKIKGKVRDDFFSSEIWINNKKQFVELASKEISFDEQIGLKQGKNVISIKAIDLTGKETRKNLTLTLDTRAPAILINELSSTNLNNQNILTLKGSLIDNYGIKRLWINDKEIVVPEQKKVLLDEQIDLSSLDSITLKAEDIAGNKVFGKYSIVGKKGEPRIYPQHLHNINPLQGPKYRFSKNKYTRNYPQLVSTDNSLIGLLVSKLSGDSNNTTAALSKNKNMSGKKGPEIESNLKPLTVYENKFALSVVAHDSAGLNKIIINDEIIICESSKDIFYNTILQLGEGDNIITISAEDIFGNKTVIPPTTIKKKTYKFLQTSSRYSVAMMPFERTGDISIKSDYIYPFLLDSFFKEPRRFNFVERNENRFLKLLKELKIGNDDLGSTEPAVKIGKIVAAEGMLFGTIIEEDTSINVSISLVDTETTKIILLSDVYTEDKNTKNIRWLMKGLALKVKQKYPMLQGTIIDVAKKGFSVDLSNKSGIMLDMKFLVFRESYAGGRLITKPLDVVAKVDKVDRQSCDAKKISGSDKIKINDLVITK